LPSPYYRYGFVPYQSCSYPSKGQH
jgi:hypothetical protein